MPYGSTNQLAKPGPKAKVFFFLIGLKAKVAHVYPNNPLKAKGLGAQDYKVA